MQSMSEKLEASLDAIAHLVCSEHNHNALGVPPSAFDGFEPLIGDDDEPGISMSAHPLDLVQWPIRVAIAMPHRGNDAKRWNTEEGTWQFGMARSVSAKDIRGRARMILPKMVEVCTYMAMPDGSAISLKTPYGLTRQRLINLEEGIRFQEPERAAQLKDLLEHATFTVKSASGFILRRRYYWSVLVADGVGPRARFITDVSGARSFFRLRDVPPGRSRRAALLHWCDGHYRHMREAGGDDRAWVREHMRGAQDFTWNGLRVRIEPSAYDAELAQQPHRLQDVIPASSQSTSGTAAPSPST